MNDNQSSCSPEEQARRIYNHSVNKPTSFQEECVKKFKKLYEKSPTDEVANFYASTLFNLSLKVSAERMEEICSELEELFHQNKTANIAERIGRIQFNLSLELNYNTSKLKQYALKIKKLYEEFPTNALAEPLAKIWYSIAISRANDRLEYAQKIINLCSNINDPGTNTAYARILFNPKFPIENREKLIGSFLSKPQALDSFGVYLESPYYPDYNDWLKNFKLAHSYSDKAFIKRINRDLAQLKELVLC